jgi:hypothetical protein
MDNENSIEEILNNSKPIVDIGSIWDGVDDYDFEKDVKYRSSGINKETFEQEILIWCEGFKLLPKYNKESYIQEMSQMEMSLQSDNFFNFEDLVIMYSAQVAYRNRLTAMKGIVNAHYEIYTQAYKSLEKQAFKLFSKAGGTIDDRKADAAHMVAPFYRLSTQAKSMLEHINEMISNVEFAATQLSRLLREREILSRVNGSIDREGQNAKLNTDYRSPIRKPRIIDEDGYETV